MSSHLGFWTPAYAGPHLGHVRVVHVPPTRPVSEPFGSSREQPAMNGEAHLKRNPAAFWKASGTGAQDSDMYMFYLFMYVCIYVCMYVRMYV